MLVVAIAGILATLGVYAVSRYQARSKALEALSNLNGISKSVHGVATRETTAAALLAAGAQAAQTTKSGSGKSAVAGFTVPGLCDTAAAVPSSMNSVKGKKYQPRNSGGLDYHAGDSFTGWRCLQFSISSPQHFQYRYNTGGQPAGVTLPLGKTPAGLAANRIWSASAQGDLDGDGVTSWFVLNGYLAANRQIVQAPAIGQQSPEE
jgi:type IV pilus assembly protein PilA